jgi:3-dehydroquinate synthase
VSATETIAVALGERSYEIEIGTGNLPRLGSFITQRLRLSQAVIITDENVHRPHAEPAAQSLAQTSVKVHLLVVEPGEKTKCAEVADTLWQKMLELGADRKTAVVAVGGGVMGDLAGFVAATFARGLPFIQVPTTLLAQVDSSVGGKVGINLPGAKNMVGAFWQPRGVLIDTAVLNTLPQREYRAGLAEVVKYGVILDEEFFAWLEAQVDAINRRDAAALRHIVARSCRLKADVVEQDEREETGLRAVLNYGHTFCHAFEALTAYEQLLHGEAVAMGMHCAARLAQRLGRVDAAFVERQQRLLESLGLSLTVPAVDHNEVLRSMSRDKKAEHGRLRFVLPTRLGDVELVENIAPDEVLAALAD